MSSKGAYIMPAPSEQGFADKAYVEQTFVGVQQLPQPVALVVLSELGHKCDRQVVGQSLEQTLNRINPGLFPYELVRKVVVVKEP